MTTASPVTAQETPTPTVESRVQDAEQSLRRIASLRQDISRLEAAASRAEGDELRILRTRIEKKHLEVLATTHEAAEHILALEEEEADVARLRERVLGGVSQIPDDLHDGILEAQEALRAIGPNGEDLTPSEESEILDARDRVVARLDSLYRALLDHIELAEKLGLEIDDARGPAR